MGEVVRKRYLHIVHPWVFFSLVGLYFVSLYSYLLFHSLAELFSVAVAFSICMISWNARRFIEDNYLLLLGIAYLIVGGIDLLHTLAYKGMGVFAGYDADLPTQLWIAARYLESLSLLAVPLFIKRKIDLRVVWAVYLAAGSILIFSIFLGVFPHCFIEGAGLTPFKKVSEYIISAVLFTSLIWMHRNREAFESRTWFLLVLSIATTIAAELAFTFYVSVYGFSNLAGHFLKLLSFYFIYKAITENSLVRPYETLFRNLKQSEATLHDQREWLRITLSSIGDAVIAADTGGQVTFINPVAEALTGWTMEEAVGRKIRNVFRIVNERTGKPAEDIVGRVLIEGSVVNLANDTALITREGLEIPIEDSAAPIKDGAGSLIGVVLVFRDVTEKRRAQAALSESAEKLRIVADFTYDWEYWRSPENRFLYVSPSCERITGYTREEFMSDPDLYSRIIHPDDRELLLAHLHQDQFHRELCEFEYRIVHRNGVERWIGHACQPVLDDRGEPIGRRATDRDITDRKWAEEALRDSESRFRLLSETAGALLKTDNPQQIVEALCREVMTHLACHAFFNFLVDHESGRLRLNACAGISEQEIRKIEWLDYGVAVCGCVARDGKRIVAEEIGRIPDPRTELIKSYGITAYACHPLMVQDNLIGTLSFGTRTRTRFSAEDLALMKTVTDQVATAMDRMRLIRELRSSRDELEIRVQERTAELRQRAEQLSLLASELTLAEERQRRRLAEILHDHLQQLLVGARLNLETLSRHIAGNHQKTYRKVCDLLMESIQTSRSLTAELSPSILYQEGLSAALEWLARWMHEKYALTVELQTDPEIVVNQESVSVLLFQSVRELLFNVVKHARVSSAAVGMYKENQNRLRIVISDRGAGFDPGMIRKGSQRSGGFGIFSIRERLEFLGGRLEVESAPGKGTRFTLIAPMGKTEAKPRLPSPGKIEERIRLMLVDDHIVMRQGLSTMFDAHPDIEIVAEAADGEAAVQLARKLKPDVILMDIGMPKVNGIEATRAIHSEMPEIRIIGLSMFEDSDIASTIMEAGASAYLTKSGNPDGLFAAIRGEGSKDSAVRGSKT